MVIRRRERIADWQEEHFFFCTLHFGIISRLFSFALPCIYVGACLRESVTTSFKYIPAQGLRGEPQWQEIQQDVLQDRKRNPASVHEELWKRRLPGSGRH